MELDEKKCPQCAEIVKAEAKICKHCGHQFGGNGDRPAAAAPPSADGGSKVKKGLFGCLGLFVLLIILMVMFGPDTPPSADAPDATSEAVPPLAVTATELAAAYDANEAAAQEQYGDRPLQVSGLVTGVTLDFSNDPVIQLAGTNQFLSVQAALSDTSKPKASSVSKGQTVTLVCSKVTEVASTPMLADCELP